MLSNVKKGIITTVIGAILLFATGAVGLGFIEPKGDVNNTYLLMGGLLGVALLLAPDAAITGVKKLIKKKTEE